MWLLIILYVHFVNLVLTTCTMKTVKSSLSLSPPQEGKDRGNFGSRYRLKKRQFQPIHESHCFCTLIDPFEVLWNTSWPLVEEIWVHLEHGSATCGSGDTSCKSFDQNVAWNWIILVYIPTVEETNLLANVLQTRD